MVTFTDVKEVTDIIKTALNPISVIVFGSVAEKGSGDDLDLLIVVDDESRDLKELHFKTNKCLKEFYKKFAIDYFVVPLSMFHEYSLKGSPFIKLVLRKGRIIYMKNAVKEWMKQSKDELDMAAYLLQGDYFKGAAYHSQQCIEKALKAILLKKGWELEKTHNIERLFSIAEEYNINILLSEEDMVFMDSIYRGRYPAEEGLLPFGEPTEVEADRAVRLALSVFDQVSSLVNS